VCEIRSKHSAECDTWGRDLRNEVFVRDTRAYSGACFRVGGLGFRGWGCSANLRLKDFLGPVTRVKKKKKKKRLELQRAGVGVRHSGVALLGVDRGRVR